MRATVLEGFGGPEQVVYEDLPEPEPISGQVVIKVKGFGLNHAEMHMRRGEWAEAAPASNVALIESSLPWEVLATVPETYASAWTCLFRNLEIATWQTIVIRGATSSFGRAAIQLARNAGVRVIATTRNPSLFRTGWFGGLDPIRDFNPLLQMASGVYLTFCSRGLTGEG